MWVNYLILLAFSKIMTNINTPHNYYSIYPSSTCGASFWDADQGFHSPRTPICICDSLLSCSNLAYFCAFGSVL